VSHQSTLPGLRIHGYSNQHLSLAIAVAVGLHALLIFGVGFEFSPSKPPVHMQQKLEVTVVRDQPKPKEVPEAPDFAAQTTQIGGGVQKNKILPTLKTTPEPLYNRNARKATTKPAQKKVEQPKPDTTKAKQQQTAPKAPSSKAKILHAKTDKARTKIPNQRTTKPSKRVTAMDLAT